MVPGYRTLDVIRTEQVVAGKIPIEVHLEKQQRVRDDESVTRPFLKLKLVVGNRVIYCDIRQAAALADLVKTVVPHAEEALDELLSSPERQRYQQPPEIQHTADGTPVDKRRVRRRVRRNRYEDQEYDINQ